MAVCRAKNVPAQVGCKNNWYAHSFSQRIRIDRTDNLCCAQRPYAPRPQVLVLVESIQHPHWLNAGTTTFVHPQHCRCVANLIDVTSSYNSPDLPAVPRRATHEKRPRAPLENQQPVASPASSLTPRVTAHPQQTLARVATVMQQVQAASPSTVPRPQQPTAAPP